MSRSVLQLGGLEWETGYVKPGKGIEAVSKWIEAKVPGNVQDDLLRAGLIDDPYYGKQNEESRWPEKFDWWYRTTLAGLPEGERLFLVFDGIDYRGHVYLDGVKVGSHEGMYSKLYIDVTGKVREGSRLEVCVENTASITDRENALKCQMSFGWDFAPTIKAIGIWDTVSMIGTDGVFIRGIRVEPRRIDANDWQISVDLETDAVYPTETKVLFTLVPFNFEGQQTAFQKEARIPAGVSETHFTLRVHSPEIWQPWEEGPSNLYYLRCEVSSNRRTHDSVRTRIGFRTTALAPNPLKPEYKWTFVINGQMKSIRGVNWVPADSMQGRITREHYEDLISLAREANVNMFRVWGGGIREKKAFYDLCDEYGIMVWQDLPFACPQRPYPRSEAFLSLAENEIEAVLKAGFNHPSVVYYCGGNEFGGTWNKPLVARAERAFRRLGGGRPFNVSSPTHGDSHNWIVHHCLGNISEYVKENNGFLSEFGMQSPPVRESLDCFMPAKHLWPIAPHPVYTISEMTQLRSEFADNISKILSKKPEIENSSYWCYHNAQLLKLLRYADQIGYHDVDSLIEASQKMQAYGLQVAIEHVRRKKGRIGGTLYWQFNEPWPAICWSIVDYYRKPKLAYHKLKHVYNPLLLSLEFPFGPYKQGQSLKTAVWLINDRHLEMTDLDIEITLFDGAGTEVSSHALTVASCRPDSAREISRLNLSLTGAEGWQIKCSIKRRDIVISVNEYDLTIVDKKPTFKPLLAANWYFHNVLWR